MAVKIPCPKCGAVLKLPDRSMLGRTGKCPKCGHRFMLAEPDEVELELVEPGAAAVVPAGAARRVEEANATASAPAVPMSDADVATPVIPVFGDAEAVPSGVQRLRELERRRARQRRQGIVVGGLVALAVAGATWAGYRSMRNQPARRIEARAPAPQPNVAFLSERERLERTGQAIAAASPTKGEPIDLRYLPAGASIILHLRPAELWKKGATGEEVRFCLGEPFSVWSEEAIRRYCLFPPGEIAEVTLCLLLGARGSEPQVATVVRPASPQKTSALIQRFDGEPRDIEGHQVYVGPQRAFVIGEELDEQHRPVAFATAPAGLAEDLARSFGLPGLTSDAMQEILAQTDRERLFTLVFQPEDLKTHEEALVPKDLRPLLNHVLQRLGENADAVAWGVSLTDDELYSTVCVRNDPRTTPAELLEELNAGLKSAPADLVAALEEMSPAAAGDRKLIGRLPAMMQLVAAATVGGIGDRYSVLETRLPERAAPNLALAGLLAWNESTAPAMPPGTESPERPEHPQSLAQRLKKDLEIDFRRMPLEEAFAYIGAEAGVGFEIDGDALKLAGYTRNMPQTIALGKVSAEKAVAAILGQYDKMAVVLDDAANRALVTTRSAAEAKGLTPATFNP